MRRKLDPKPNMHIGTVVDIVNSKVSVKDDCCRDRRSYSLPLVSIVGIRELHTSYTVPLPHTGLVPGDYLIFRPRANGRSAYGAIYK